MKNEIESIKKDKNVLSVALKGSKKEIKEMEKTFAKEREVFEDKIRDLKEYKNRKLNEEREEKVQKREDAKRAKQKEKNENKDNPKNTALNEVKTEVKVVLVHIAEPNDILNNSKDDENENVNVCLKILLQLNMS